VSVQAFTIAVTEANLPSCILKNLLLVVWKEYMRLGASSEMKALT
jgi:hypothetical protein